ncbi:nitrate reductase molybdenum cofactor assembly chaperone [Nocardia sp. NBC_00511]|uniref:nitrate reductase molybdenum cofactor assembly chaperone n=1 Tax=Nocardia sp. NBC_00511 TaxID=2903591 RepID=UPI0030DE8120
MAATRPALYQAAAHCLDYPDADFLERLPLLRECAPELRPFLDYAASVELAELARNYVSCFDFRKRHCLHLTWWMDGDTRRRGESLVAIKQAFRDHGLELQTGELPDYLPAILEFAAATGSIDLLVEHRPGLELLRLALVEQHDPYANVLQAVCATLPGASPKDQAAARALARSGPRSETVGVAPYGHLDLLPILTTTGDRR